MRRTPFVLACLAAGALLSACGQTTPPRAAPATTTPAPTGSAPARFDSVKLLAESTESSINHAKSGHLTTTVTNGAMTMLTQSCDFRVGETAPRLAMDCVEDVATPDGKMMHLGVVVAPNGAYLLLPPSTGKRAVPTPWMKINTASADPRIQQFTRLLDQVQSSFDVKKSLPDGAAISKSANDQLDGKPATRYDVTVNVADLAHSADPQQQTFAKLLSQAGITTTTSTIWLGANGIPLEISSTTPQSKLQKPGVGDSTVVIKFSDWGKDVTVTDPPADQVTLFPAK